MKKIVLILSALILAIGAHAKDRLTEMPAIKYSSSPAVLKGIIKGYTTNHKEAMLLTYMQPGTADAKQMVSTISTMYPSKPSDGTFEFLIPIKYTDRVSITFREKTYVMMLVPGEEAIVTIDMKLLEKPKSKKPILTFTGSFGDFNTDLAQYADEYESMKIIEPIQSREGLNTLKGLTVSQYRDRVLELYQEGRKHLMADKRLCGAFKQYVDATYQYQIIIKTLLYNTTLNVVNETSNNMVTYERPDDYYDYLQDMKPFESPAFFYIMNTLVGVNTSDYIMNFSNQKNLKKHESAKQLLDAYKYMRSIAEFNPLTDEDITKVKADCPQLADAVLEMNDELLKKVEEAKNSTAYKVINLDENLKGEDIFKQLIAPYKGKPLLVDFWATWCGPCKAAMKTILPVKEKFAGKANFIYVTGPTSPRKTWEMTIPEIHGDHYYVTDVQYQALLEQFQSEGIPTYVIVDKDGHVKNKYIGYPGNDVMEEQLK